MEVDAKIKEILKKIDLSAHSVKFVEEKISPDIVCRLSKEDLHNLGVMIVMLSCLWGLHVLHLVAILPEEVATLTSLLFLRFF